ncbi:solute carrier organic anion transporter family member 1A2 isoform X1 [Anoplophora glabripennis]|uniref:solute carrier organic anion transporter family member 1A2 isoform X1 n=1 Tax=Anoplophora glabripennis TaxID=217634 RepID=UPI0008758984|nr:solute carrier organic anion transporter family member 1A2 isoform X1 [Anoplophora glabripennis]
MIHPTELLRTNSDEEQNSFSAPVGNYLNQVDCGISALPCLTKCLNLERCAKFGVFVTVLSLVGLFHGAILVYFRGTSHIWSEHYNISLETVDWLIYTNEVFVGLFSLCVAYWGNRLHRAGWLGALTIFLAIACATLAVPEIYNPLSGSEIDSSITGPILCNSNRSMAYSDIDKVEKEVDIITFAVVIIFQMILAMATVSFITHGMTYIDDHISPKHSPGFIGLAFGANEIGKQVGLYCSWGPYVIDIDSIFISPAWITLLVLTFIIGIAIAMFPKALPNIVMIKSVNSLLSLASGNDLYEEEEVVEGFFKSLWGLLKNKVLSLTIFSVVFVQAALINFSILQKQFNQSKYHVSVHNDSSGYSDPFLIQFTTNLLKQPMVAISVITSGMMIAKIRPKAKYLVWWNIIVFSLIALFFASTVFWNCAGKIENEHSNTITIPYCSSHCGCSPDAPFQPVCVDKRTYFSPCLAGCKNYSALQSVYTNCSCGQTVTDGSCYTDNCSIILALSQANSIISAGLLATTVVSNIVIMLRCVPTKQKAFALGLAYTYFGIIPYLPLRFSYRAIADTFCEIHGSKGCQFFSEYFPIFLSSITISLILLAVVFAVILLFFVGKLELYDDKDFKSTTDMQLERIRRNRRTQNNEEDNTDLDSGGEDSQRFLRNDRQMSEGRINLPRPRSKEDRISTYLSEGDLVPPLKPIHKRSDVSTSKNSTNSGLSSDSLKAIASVVGDDHDSDSFSNTSRTNAPNRRNVTPSGNDIVETSF